VFFFLLLILAFAYFVGTTALFRYERRSLYIHFTQDGELEARPLEAARTLGFG